MGPWDYFVAHARPDAAVAARLAELLTAGGASVFLDANDLLPGDVWPKVLAQAQESSAVTVLLVSNHTGTAYYELEELASAISRTRHGDPNHRVAPVYLEPVDKIPYGLEIVHGLEAFDDAGLERSAAQLLRLPPRAGNDRASKIWSPLVPLVTRFFAGRKELVGRLAAPRPGRALVLTQSVAGLGGVGKTTVAAALCWEQADVVDIVWWVRAETETTLIQDLSDLAAELGLPGGDDLSILAERACRALERDGRNWLLVFDNAVREDQVHRFTPKRGNGRILVTTRRRDFGRIGPVIALDAFDQETAEAFLRDRVRDANPAAADEPAAAEVAQRLGGLPLALEQAGAYVAYSPRRSFATYLHLLEESGLDPFVEGKPLDYDATATTTWQVSIDAAARTHPLAPRIMAAFGYLAPAPVPLAYFVDLASHPYLAAAPEEVSAAIDELYAYSLVTLEADALSVHRLVRDAAIRHADPAASPFVIDALVRAHPRDATRPATWPTCAGLLPHVLTVAVPVQEDPFRATKISWLLDRAGTALRYAGVAAQAIPILAQALDLSAGRHGPDHPDTLRIRHELASAYQLAGRTVEAIALHEPNLADMTRILGPDHRDSLMSRNNLALAYQDAGRTAEAIAMHQANLADRERVLGPDHRETLQSRNNIATAYHDTGRTADAITLHQAVLADRERVLEPDDSDTIQSRNNLAVAYRTAGRATEAIPLLEVGLAARRRLLGPHHPISLQTRGNLALAYQDAGRIAEAITLLEENLADMKRLLGPDHPDALKNRNNLAAAYQAAGRSAEAITLDEANLADTERLLGPDHPSTRRRRDILADAYHAAGRTTEAAALLGQNHRPAPSPREDTATWD